MNIQRIRIIGATGSGKTYLAKAICDYTDYVCLNLDKIYFKYLVDGKPQYYTEQYRFDSLHCFLKYEKWIIEGSYYQNWAISSFEQADLILVLNIPRYIRNCRVIKRSIQKHYSLEALIRHLKYSYLWEKNHKEKVFETLESFHQKVRVVNSFKEAIRLINPA